MPTNIRKTPMVVFLPEYHEIELSGSGPTLLACANELGRRVRELKVAGIAVIVVNLVSNCEHSSWITVPGSCKYRLVDALEGRSKPIKCIGIEHRVPNAVIVQECICELCSWRGWSIVQLDMNETVERVREPCPRCSNALDQRYEPPISFVQKQEEPGYAPSNTDWRSRLRSALEEDNPHRKRIIVHRPRNGALEILADVNELPFLADQMRAVALENSHVADAHFSVTPRGPSDILSVSIRRTTNTHKIHNSMLTPTHCRIAYYSCSAFGFSCGWRGWVLDALYSKTGSCEDHWPDGKVIEADHVICRNCGAMMLEKQGSCTFGK